VLNGGMTAMLPLASMQGIYGIDGTNLLLIQLDEYTPEIISQIEDIAETYGLGIYQQEPVLQENLRVIAAYWSLLHPLSIMALVAGFLSLMYYLLISVFGRFRDYVIMRSVGAPPKFIAKTMLAEGIDIGLKAGIPAVLTAIIFSMFFLVPEAAVTSISYFLITSGLVLSSLMIVVCLAVIPVYLIFTSRSDLRVSEFAV
ncbi:MAG: FtsX-like permease family protein, partial [Candidatus Thorarchaeota archaeon]